MGGIDDDDVHAGFDQRGHAVVGVCAGADAGPGAQLAVVVLAGAWVRLRLGDVLDGHHALEFEAFVHQQHLFDAVLVQERGDGADVRAFAGGD